MSRAYFPAKLTIINGATSAATPPVYNSGNGWGVVPDSWKGGAVEEFDLELWADGTNNITDGRLVAGTPETEVIVDDDVDTVDFGNNELDLTSHAYVTGDGPVRLTTTDTLPAGLAEDTDYWIEVVNSGSIRLHWSLQNALNSVNEVAFSDGGTGTHTIEDTADTKRIRWLSQGNLGEDGDGAVALTSLMGYRVRCKHANPTVVYAIVGTFSDTVATYGKLVPLDI